MPDGIQNTNRVENTGNPKIYAKVVDNILNGVTLMTRFQGMGRKFTDKEMRFTIKITDSARGEFFTGLENLNSTAANTTIQLAYTHTGFEQPVVLPLLESMANAGPEQAIDLDMFNLEEAQAEAKQRLGSVAYGRGQNSEPLGLGAIVDDGTDVGSIGGQSRTIHPTLKATRTASGGTLSLAKLATLYDAISAAGLDSESPTIGMTTKTIGSLYEQLLTPAVRAEYSTIGYDVLPVRGDYIMKRPELKGGAGFNAFTYRGVPLAMDDMATSGYLYFLNERYTFWAGRSVVPAKWSSHLQKVELGTPKTIEGAAAAPSKYNGWFFQDFITVPNQAGLIARYYVIGQLVCSQPRRNGVLTGITGV